MSLHTPDWAPILGGLAGFVLGSAIGYVLHLDLLAMGAVGLVIGVAGAVSLLD